jgi:microcystin-dependent protein
MSDPYLGEIRLFAGNFAPVGWNLCDGTVLAISTNDALFNLIGTTYGGDGVSTFALPDLRSRVPVGQGNGPGLSPRTIGQSYGTESVTLTTQQIPGHSHMFMTTSGAASVPNPQNALFANTGGDNLYLPAPNNPEPKALAPQAVANVGGSQPHDNIMRSVGMNYIICLEGIYPPQS